MVFAFRFQGGVRFQRVRKGVNHANRSTKMTSLSLFALFLAGLSMCLPTSTAIDVIVNPPVPLLNVPFNVTSTSLHQGDNLYLSLSPLCDTSQLVGSICPLPESRNCEFVVSAKSVGVSAQYDREVPLLYMCSSATNPNSIGTVQVSVIDAMPRYVFPGTSFSLTIGAATPTGTIIGFFVDECKTAITGVQSITLQEDHHVNVQIPSGDIVRLCARIPLGGGDFSAYQPAAALLIVQPFSVQSTSALRHTTHTYLLEPFNQIPFVSFSSSPTCEVLLQDPVSGYMLQSVALPILVPKGSYYLCTGLPYYKSTRVYVPGQNVVSIREYGIQPHTMYANALTTMKLTLDSTSAGSTAALFRSSDCTQSPIIAWTTSMLWTVTTPGIYYACVRSGGLTETAALATNITVLNGPSVSFSRTPAIRGLNVVVNLIRDSFNGIIAVGVALLADCASVVSSGVTTNTGRTATFRIPEDALSTMSLCVSTPRPVFTPEGEDGDKGFTYALTTIETRQYNLSYGPIFTGHALSFTLDNSVLFNKGSQAKFTQGSCEENGISNSFALGPDVSVLDGVIFPESGGYLFCIAEENAAFFRLQTVTSYGPAKLSTNSILLGILTTVNISMVPPNAPVSIVASNNCDVASTPIATTTANISGVALIELSFSSETNLTVCVGYRGSNAQADWSTRIAGILTVARPKALPIAVVVGQSNRVNLAVPDKMSLVGFKAYITGEASCGAPPSTGTVAVVIPNKGYAFVLYQPSVTGSLTVCVGLGTNIYISAGTITAVTPLSLTASPPTGIFGLPMTIQFGGTSLQVLKPTRYFVTDKPGSCAQTDSTAPPNYGSGSMDSTSGKADPFVVNTNGDLTLCAGWEDESGTFFIYGGRVAVANFTAVSRYAIHSKTNNLVGYPMLKDSSLFLVSCNPASLCTGSISPYVCTSATTRFYTSPILPLQGAVLGEYVLCQEDAEKTGAAASDVLVHVVDPFLGTLQDSELRQYKSMTVLLSGGDLSSRQTSTQISTVPENVDCNAVDNTERENFLLPAGSKSVEITVTKIQPYIKKVRLCVVASPKDFFTAGIFDLLPYMTPATIIAGRNMAVRSGQYKDGVVAKLTVTSDCNGNAMSVDPVLVNNFVSTLRVDGCASSVSGKTTLYYCESVNGGGSYALRGTMALIRLQNCSTGAATGVLPIAVPPSLAITDFGLDTSLLISRGLATSTDCAPLLNGNQGYTPSYEETAKFFVCASAKSDPGFIFTTDKASLTVKNHAASPLSLPSLLSSYTVNSIAQQYAVTFSLNYATASDQTFVSNTVTCDSVVLSTPGLHQTPPSVRVSFIDISGMKYICTSSSNTSKVVAVAVFLVMNPPVVTSIDPALVRGAPFRATLQILPSAGQPPLYSIVPGADASFISAPFYVFSFRGIFLSSDACATVVAGSASMNANVAGRVALPTTDIATGWSTLSLCAGTPAGNYTVANNIKISTDVIFPSKFVLGADINVYVPLSSNNVLHMSQDDDCSDVSMVPAFITNDEGRGNLSFRRALSDELPPSGLWVVCQESDTSPQVRSVTPIGRSIQDLRTQNMALPAAVKMRPLATVEAFNPVYFNSRGSDFVIGTPGVLLLLDDLNTSFLLPGFSTSRSCADRSTAYGTWTETSGKRITVKALDVRTNMYLCAVAPINESLLAIPAKGSLHFVTPTLTFPSTVSQCDPLTLSSCTPPGTSPSKPVIKAIVGDCCSLADRGNVVGTVMTDDKGGKCSLQMNPTALTNYPADTTCSVCVWDADDTSFCTTVGRIKTTSDSCSDASIATNNTLSKGAMIAIIILAILLALILVAILLFYIRRYCRKDRVIFAYPVSSSETSPSNLHAMVPFSEGSLERAKRGSLVTTGGRSSWGQGLVGSDRNPLILPPEGMTLNSRSISGSSNQSQRNPRRDLWEGIEEDERDQIALQEARDRYNIRIAFSERLEWLRITEKERQLEDDFSDDGYDAHNPSGQWHSLRSNPLNPMNSMDPFVTVRQPSAPVDDQEVGEEKKGKSVAVEVTPEKAIGCGLHEIFALQESHRSVSLSSDAMSYTITQRFFDEGRVLLEREMVLRQRLENWEEEERHDLVDVEFTQFVRFQVTSFLPHPPPLPEERGAEEEDVTEMKRHQMRERTRLMGAIDTDDIRTGSDPTFELEVDEASDEEEEDLPAFGAPTLRPPDRRGVTVATDAEKELGSESIFSLSLPSLGKEKLSGASSDDVQEVRSGLEMVSFGNSVTNVYKPKKESPKAHRDPSEL